MQKKLKDPKLNKKKIGKFYICDLLDDKMKKKIQYILILCTLLSCSAFAQNPELITTVSKNKLGLKNSVMRVTEQTQNIQEPGEEQR